MPRRILASFDSSHEVNEGGGVREEVLQLEDMAVARTVHPVGWKWSTDVKPIVGTDLCQHRHVGFVLSGRLVFQLADGSIHRAAEWNAYDVPPGHDSWVEGEAPAVVLEWVGLREWLKPSHRERILASLLFTDIVDSTVLASRLGDKVWRARLEAHDAVVRGVLQETRGIEIKTTGDGFLCRFDGVAQGLTAAMRIRERMRTLELEVRQGFHVGEVELRGKDVAGLAVHEAARVAASSGAGEVRVSAIVHSLASGAFSFEALGARVLKGFEGPRELFLLTGKR
jgi:class 3 adenylate cyclase